MKGWNIITKTTDGVWALHDAKFPPGMAETIVYYYEKSGNYVCQLCHSTGRITMCHHVEAVIKHEQTLRRMAFRKLLVDNV